MAIQALGAGRTDASAFLVNFYSVPSAAGIVDAVNVPSRLVTSSLGPAALSCWEAADAKACNALANICVLQVTELPCV